jgi:predicted phosphodiesterase
MRLAVISDIHGNMDAFECVLNDIDQSGVDAVVSLGDNIGYGPQPNDVIKELLARSIPSIMGNHELAVIDSQYLEWFNPAARKSLFKTLEILNAESVAFISDLDTNMLANGAYFVHGFPPDSPLTYSFQIPDSKKMQVIEQLSDSIYFIGHTHTLELFEYNGHDLNSETLDEGLTSINPKNKYIINIGSVGQPRDGNNKAKYVIWDSSQNSIEVRFVPYDIAAVVKKIEAADLPKEHAQRLW